MMLMEGFAFGQLATVIPAKAGIQNLHVASAYPVARMLGFRLSPERRNLPLKGQDNCEV